MLPLLPACHARPKMAETSLVLWEWGIFPYLPELLIEEEEDEEVFDNVEFCIALLLLLLLLLLMVDESFRMLICDCW